MRETKADPADPTLAVVALWLKQLDRGYLHDQGWAAANKRYHSVAMAARPFIKQHFGDAAEQEAAFDGFALALSTLAHFEDLASLLSHLQSQATGQKKQK